MLKNCEVCGVEYRVKPRDFQKSRYCSYECKGINHKIEFKGENNPNYKNAGWLICQRCGQNFKSYNKSRKYCSQKCAGNYKHLPDPDPVAPLCACGCGQPVNWNRYTGRWYKFAHRTKPPRSKPRLNLEGSGIVKLQKRKSYPEREKNRTRIVTCSACGVKFTWGNMRKFCPECSTRRHNKDNPNCVCVICGKAFYDPYKPKTCSKQCSRIRRSEIQKGEKSHRWQGGKLQAAYVLRNSYLYQDWRKAVFERDHYTCQLCDKAGGKLAAHHIKLISLYPDLGFEVWNGITLCWPCHRSIKNKEQEYEDRFYAITKPTEAQRRFMAEVEARGGIAVVATSIEDVQKALESASRRGVGG